jgi:hypothetical protein
MESSFSRPEGSPVAVGTAPQRERNLAIAAAVLLLIGMPVSWLPDDGAAGLIVVSLISLGLLAADILWLVPRERAAGRASRASLILGIASVVSILVFWTGLPFALAPGAIALGLSAREAASVRRGQPTAGILLGCLALLVAFLALILGGG